MVNIYVIANCQLDSIEFLAEDMVVGAAVRGVELLDPHLKNPAFQQACLEFMHKADYIIIQPGESGFLNSETVKREFQDKTFTAANIYFRGLHPDIFYMGNYENRIQKPSQYHSIIVLDAFKRGLSKKRALDAFTVENFERLGLFYAWESSLDELRNRDKLCDLPVASLIDSYCHEFSGFLSINHPSIGLMSQYFSAVFRRMGLPCHPMNLNTQKDPLAIYDAPPIHDLIAEHFNLPYRTTQHWKIGSTFLSRSEFVERSYEAYRGIDPKELTVHSPLDLYTFLKSDARFENLVECT